MSVGTVIERKRRNLGSSVQQFPKNLGAHAMLFTFKKYEYEKPGSRTLNKVTSTTLSTANLAASDNIMLPLPGELKDSYQIGISGNSQELEGEAISTAAKAMSNMQDFSISSFNSAMHSAFPDVYSAGKKIAGMDRDKQLGASIDLATGAAQYLGRRGVMLPKEFSGHMKDVDAGLGNAINPKQALYFSGVDLKKHSFSWNFAPTNSSESDILKNIGNTIKRNILPTYGNIGPVSRLLLNYPSVVDIYFFGVDQSYFLHYKTCMVESFNINFAPNGLAFVQGGRPAAVSMDMSVTEMDIHTAEDYTAEQDRR